MNNLKRIVFATNNIHKLEEARNILGDSFEIVSLSEIGCHDDIPETAETLEGNALIKARWVKERYGCDCFSDDTGLMVDALGGAPGVYSARYAGESCTPADNVAKLLGELKDVTDRKAHFSTVVAYVTDSGENCFEGRVDGRIATEAHGNGGFGYDPIFVADETGRCFAEMEPEEKNAISHRGRALRKFRDFLGTILAIIVCCLGGFTANAQQWRLHPSYDGQMERIVDTPEMTYFLGASQDYDRANTFKSTLYGVLMRYDKDWDEMTLLNSQNSLSSDTPVAVEYNFSKRYLVIAYLDGNIDILYDNGNVVNVPGLKLADASQSKTVNSISIDEESNTIFLATDFGYITVNGDNGTVGTSRTFNEKINAACLYDGKLWIATSKDVKCGSLNDFSLDKFETVADVDMVERFLPLKKRGLFILHGKRNDMRCTAITPNATGYDVKQNSIEKEYSMEKTKDGVALLGTTTMRYLRESGNDTWLQLEKSDYGLKGGTYDGKNVWFSDGRKGIRQKGVEQNQGATTWKLQKDNFFPNVSSAFFCSSMVYSPEYGMIVRNHGMDHNFNTAAGNFLNTKDLVSGYKDMTWKRYSTTYLSDSKGLQFYDPNGAVIDPNNPDHLYCGSMLSGLLRLNLKDVNKSLHITKKSDWSGGAGETGFVELVPEAPENAFWGTRSLFATPSFDASGNLWTAYVNPEPNDEGSPYTEFWYWTPQDRAATTSAANARPFKKIKVKDVAMSNNPKMLALKTSANKNILVIHGNRLGEPMLIYDHNGTPDNTSDDKMVKMLTISDQDGTTVPFVYALSFYEDPLTGQVWVGGSNGLFIIDPKTVFSNPSQVRRVKVPRNDGTNLADYLLDGVVVNQIISDATGNKWFATNGAGLMCTSSDGREVLHSYTSENSPLPGDNVYSICLNTDNNSMMISTDKGLCELMLSGTAADSSNDVRVYPNPVRPTFHGYVTIDGLPSEAMVKIVDTSGGIVKDLGQASLGSIEWDVTNNRHVRVPGGVYFVVASNGPDADSYSKMAKILVID